MKILYKLTNSQKNYMHSFNKLKFITGLVTFLFLLNACNGKLPGADARKVPYDPSERVKKNIEQGKGFRLMDNVGGKGKGGDFEFASANELWRASLDVIDFMPLTSVNYSGGIIITDWYSDQNKPGESIKITIRFLTNEVRSDALDITIFNRKCMDSLMNCKVIETDKVLVNEIQKQILKKAAIYEKESVQKRRKRKE